MIRTMKHFVAVLLCPRTPFALKYCIEEKNVRVNASRKGRQEREEKEVKAEAERVTEQMKSKIKREKVDEQ